jgi:hypothetical protein
MALIHFLLVYDLQLQRLVSKDEFTDATKAAAEYARLEEKHRGNSDLEIVLVGADSLESLKTTHGHYFDAVKLSSASPFLTGV